jgi:hypothetical protein
LRHVRAIGEQAGEHLEPRDDVGCQVGRNVAHRLQHAVDPPGRAQAVGSGKQVQIAGADLRRRRQQGVDQFDRRLRILGAGGGDALLEFEKRHAANPGEERAGEQQASCLSTDALPA